MHLEVRPEIALARTKGFRVTRTERHVSEELLREQLDRRREQHATWTPSTDRPLPGNMVTVQLATADESGTMSEPREYRIVLGAGQAIPGIEELITETSPGQTTERPVKWPDDFPDEAQRGKTKMTRVTVADVKRRTLPELDDAFARETGDFETLDALRAAVREDLVKHAEREAEADVRGKLIDEISGANRFDVPASWVNQTVQAYIEAYEVPEEERERFRAEFRPMAERQVRRDMIVEAIAKQEGLIATEAELDARVAELAARQNADPGQVYASLQKAGRLSDLERGITEERVFGWLLENNLVEKA
ncbi:MAG: trigger factor [Candidatus Rokuibacteriota bacterium]